MADELLGGGADLSPNPLLPASFDSVAADNEQGWTRCRSYWNLAPDTLYLNHGSFGPPPRWVQAARAGFQEQLDRQPMDFFVRRYESLWFAARRELAGWLNAPESRLVFTENATAAMNLVAAAAALRPGDEVILTDHEYGAVRKTWQHACRRSGAELREVPLPQPLMEPGQVVDAVHGAVTPRTRLIVVSHITSATALVLPVAEICRIARRAGAQVCIDGPHALAQVDVDLKALDCDYYAASCHKWLSAPFGSGFLYVAEGRPTPPPSRWSWGRIQPAEPETWDDEFVWSGTRDPSAFFAVGAAITFLRRIGVAAFRRRSRYLANYAREQLETLGGSHPLAPAGMPFYASMAHFPLPEADADYRGLQARLWQRHHIEIPVIQFHDRWWIRVSCHLYNGRDDIDYLISALTQEIGG